MIHALKDCAKTRSILTHGGMDDKLFNLDWMNGIDWLESVIRLLGRKAFECLTIILWNI